MEYVVCVRVVVIEQLVAGSRLTVRLMLTVVMTNCNKERVGHLCLSLFYADAAWCSCACCICFALSADYC